MKFAKFARLCLLLAVMASAISSCKKSGNAPKNLIGTWNELPNPGGYSRGVVFGAEGSFSAVFVAYPRPDGIGGVYAGTTTLFKGTYLVKRDSLLTQISTVSIQENTGTPLVTPSTQKLFEYATFRVDNNKLTINYTTYPADAPVPTQVTYVRDNN